jgi:hypothetical protein
VPAFLLSGCSSAPAEPVSLTSLTWEELSETPEYKDWLAKENCYLNDLDEVNNLNFLPIKQSDSESPTPREVMVTRTARLKTSMAGEASRLKMLSEVSTWDEYTLEEKLRGIWMTPSDVTNSIDIWVTDRSNLAIGELSTTTFSTAVRDNIKSDWESKCDNETILAEVSTTLEEYAVSLDALSTKLVANFEKRATKITSITFW